MEKLNWAILGCGTIANEFANCLIKHGETIYSVCNRTYHKATVFAEKYGISKVYDNCEELFSDPNIDIVYISTPHNTHFEYIKKALENKKNVLCEKSITLNSTELKIVQELAEENHLVLAEAMTIYHMPLFKQLSEIISKGELGKVNVITMNFGSFKDYDMNNRFFNKSLAGGALLDIGTYAISCARWFLSSKPDNIVSQVNFAPSSVDEQATFLMMNQQNQMVTVALSLHSKQPKRAMISCEKGYIEIMEYPRASNAIITDAQTGEKRIIEEGNTETALYYEYQDMNQAVVSSKNNMHLDYSEDVINIMTELRNQWGMKYPEE